MADKKYWGISLNRQYFQGEVTENPLFFDDGNGGEMATINLLMYISELSSNGQWIETETIVPITVLDQNKVESTRKFITAGRQLYVESFYKSWVVAGVIQHANVVTKMQFGYKPKEEDVVQQGVASKAIPPQPE